MAQFELNGAAYTSGRLDAMKQFHVTRRLLPILAEMGMSASMLAQLREEEATGGIVGVMGPVMDIISKMPDEDVEYIVRTCLAVVKRQQGEAWAPVQAANGHLMFADIDMTVMIRLTIEVLKGNLEGFFGTPPSAAKL
jgi:hypothetical protein